jgi:hypothetical protein
MAPSRPHLLAFAVCLNLISLSTALPLPSPWYDSRSPSRKKSLSPTLTGSRLSRRDHDHDAIADEDQDNVDGMPPHLLAIIITCTVVGVLLLSAIAMGVFLWYHRRHVPAPAPEQVQPSGFNDEKRRSHSGFEDIEIGAPQRPPPAAVQCSWCYIAENKLCKWCAGEAQDEDDYVQDAGRGKLLVDTTDLKHSGWRSVLNSPAPSRNPTPPGSRSRS